MKNRPWRLGLIVEGNTTHAAIFRLEKLAEILGPIKSTVPSTARRFSNSMRGGYPVADYEGLKDANIIFIRVPDGSISRVVAEMAESKLDLHQVSVVLCETWQGVESLSALRQRGAYTATLMQLAVGRRDWFVADGDSKAARLARRLLESKGCKVTELSAKGKHFLFAAQVLLSALPVPLFVGGQQALRESGFSGNLLVNVLEQMLARSVKDMMLGAKGRWGGPLLECSEVVAESHLAALSELRPELGAFTKLQLTMARTMMQGKR